MRAAAGWLFFHVVRSLRINLDTLVARAFKKNWGVFDLADRCKLSLARVRPRFDRAFDQRLTA